MTIIGLGFSMRSGKDTAGDALVRDLGFTRVSFADKLKELAIEANPLITSNVQVVNIGTGAGRLAHVVKGLGGWDQAKDLYPYVREFLQDLGLGARRVFGEDFWVRQALDGLDPDGDYVVTDCRFRNEAEAIQAAGGKMIHIDRPGRRTAGHVSETELEDWDGWDAVVVNDRSVQDLQIEIVSTVKDLTAPKKPARRAPAKKKAETDDE